MNSRSISRLSFLATGLVGCGSLVAADYTEAPTPATYKISVGTRFFFNVSTSVSHASSPDRTGPATGGGLNRIYDDGAVLLDISGNAGGKTWNWAYEGPAQAAGGAIQQSRTTGPRHGSTSDLNTDMSFGGEVGWSWELRRFDIGKREARAGFDLFAGWNQVSGKGSSLAAGSYTVQTDSFALNGVTPPLAPYAGSFAGPGPLLSDNPTRSTVTQAATSQFAGDLDATMIGFRVGPWIEIPLTQKLSWSMGFGLSAVHVDGSFSFSEQVSVAGVPQPVVSGKVDRADWKSGFYVDTKLNWNINPEWSVFAGLQYQYLGTFKIEALGRQGQIGLESAIGITAGVGFSF